MTNIPHLHQLLPHQQPMVLIDELIDVGEDHIHCQVTISEDCLFFDPNNRSIPGYVGIEFMAQTVAGWSGYHAWRQNHAAPIGFLLGSRRYDSDYPQFDEHQTFDIYAEKVMENNGMAAFSCRIEHQGTQIAKSQLNAFVPTDEQLEQMLNRNPS
ncbi:3-hydroxydecanoyl-ACP dehydratase [Photobacterium jeanii]|uniref:3-hydroxydecanoyl-ACP dehydratase n=1 Tax=Photobacterium jeanii TaxID=858640 RepID=A0A178K235_9GAMM|nr:hotdog family protein [Photobacterium jeanii]OAN11005.1 3-hydroxydecanoyl-ACP dehydratase [Photobacterium jeanii]PST90520.1 3-hydroxydecanoyl-ACP dehydratase [Photobacterium jeanii]